MPLSAAERQRRWRRWLAGELPPVAELLRSATLNHSTTHPTMNCINPAFSALQIYERITPLNEEQKILNQEVISIWKRADKSRDQPRQFIELFGQGLAKFSLLPENFKRSVSIYVYDALCEAGSIATKNKIRVTFDVSEAIFE